MVRARSGKIAAATESARRIGAAVVALGIERFDLLGEGAGAAAAVWLALAPEADIGSVVLPAPDGLLIRSYSGCLRIRRMLKSADPRRRECSRLPDRGSTHG
jgi:pimeloyl-ACP methyl ester carboxylesterase